MGSLINPSSATSLQARKGEQFKSNRYILGDMQSGKYLRQYIFGSNYFFKQCCKQRQIVLSILNILSILSSLSILSILSIQKKEKKDTSQMKASLLYCKYKIQIQI